MSVPLRFQARRERMAAVEDFVVIKPKAKERAKFRVVQDGTRFSVWFNWNDDEPVLYLDRMTHLSSAVQMIAEGKRRLGTDVLISVDNPFTVERNRKYI